MRLGSPSRACALRSRPRTGRRRCAQRRDSNFWGRRSARLRLTAACLVRAGGPALLPDRGHGAHSPALPFDSLVPFHHTRRSRFGTPLFAQVVEWDECAALPRCARSCTSMIAWLAHLRFLQTLLVRRVRFDVRLMQRVPVPLTF